MSQEQSTNSAFIMSATHPQSPKRFYVHCDAKLYIIFQTPQMQIYIPQKNINAMLSVEIRGDQLKY